MNSPRASRNACGLTSITSMLSPCRVTRGECGVYLREGVRQFPGLREFHRAPPFRF